MFLTTVNSMEAESRSNLICGTESSLDLQVNSGIAANCQHELQISLTSNC